jgi:5'-3' exonuclease
MKKDLLIIDTRLLAYETYHKHLPFISFVEFISSYVSNYVLPNRIVWAYDSREGSKRRKELYPEYKAHRKELIKTEAEKNRLQKFNDDYNKVESILQYLGNVIHLPGYEADDIANILTDKLKDKYNIWLLSSDKDWLVNLKADNIKQLHLKRGLITSDNVFEEFGVLPENIIKVQALAGVAKENIKGVYRLGEKRVYKMLNEGLTINEIIDIIQEWVGIGKFGMKLPDGFSSVREMYEFNYEVLRPLVFDDLKKDEQIELLKQINYRKQGNVEQVEQEIIEKFNQPILFNEQMKKFYHIKE